MLKARGVGSTNNVEKSLRRDENEDNCMLCVQDEEKKRDAFICVLQTIFFQQVTYQ
jgi:hypothetical protein